MDKFVQFTGICLVSRAVQRHKINQQLLKLVIGLRLYGVVWCRRLSYDIVEGNSVLTNNGRQVVLE